MNSPLESGLFLPIRFYNSKAEQDRYKSQSEGVSFVPQNYIHVDCVSLAPFQFIKNNDCEGGYTLEWKIICSSTLEEVSLPFNLSKWEFYLDINRNIVYISYLGNDNFAGLLGNGKYYLEITTIDECAFTHTVISDEFMINNCAAPADNDEHLLHSRGSTNRIKINTTDLLIIKKQ